MSARAETSPLQPRPENGGAQDTWRVEIAVPAARHVAPFEAALDGLGGALTVREIEGGKGWRLISYHPETPDRAALSARLAVAAAAAGIAAPEPLVDAVPPTDWVAEYQRRVGPLRVARFFIHPSHFAGAVPDRALGIRIDAGPAFGTGAHESTRGCLVALDRLAPPHDARRIARALDMGCGSGILAIAIARLWQARVVACDVDPVAVRLCADNARENGVAALIEAVESDGFTAPQITAGAPYDLVVANILAQPLIDMAAALARHLDGDGAAVLSGMLAGQAEEVAARHARHGLRVVDHIRIAEWSTLVLARVRF